jgi:anti-sigma B factor antagonist
MTPIRICATINSCLMSEAATSRITLDVDRSGDHIVVRCRGMLVAGVNEYLYTEVSPLIPGAKEIVLDLTELTHMDSMGLGSVVRLYVSAKSSGCDLKLINLGPRIRKILGVTHLLTVLATVGETGISYF